MLLKHGKLRVLTLFLLCLLLAALAGCDDIKEITFLSAGPGYGGNNEIPIFEDGQGYKGWDDGSAILDPVWVSGSPGKNRPVCYIRSKAGAASRIKVEALVQVGKSGQQFTLVGLDGNTEYFRKENITSTGQNQKVALISKVDLPSNAGILNKTFTWKAIYTGGQADKTTTLGSSTHKIYVVYNTPLTTVEAQANQLTLKRLDLVVGAASGKSNLVDVANSIAYEISQQITGSYGQYAYDENPRWRFLARETWDRDLDCHHRAALATSALGIIGINGTVDKCYATCYPVPPSPYGTNPTVNDYMSLYTDNRFKWKSNNGVNVRLMFPGNNFEGNLRVADGSADGGYVWWTIWPFKKHNTGKDLLIWYAGGCQIWSDAQNVCVQVPVNNLANEPKIAGGPN